MLVEQPEQVVFRDQLLQRHHLQFRLSRVGRLEHANIIKKQSPQSLGGFVSSLNGATRAPFRLLTNPRFFGDFVFLFGNEAAF